MTRRPWTGGMRETAVARRRVHRGRAVDFWVDKVRLPSGGTAVREYLGHPGAVAAVPVLEGPRRNPRILFVRQYRYPVAETTIELPAGKLSRGEAPLVCVGRELEEETGYRAGRFRKILSFWPTAAFADEVIHIFAARDLAPGRFQPDDDEFLRPAVFPLDKALRMIKSGAIRDSKSIIGLLAFARWRPS